jgi:hypothetical protein
VASDAKAGDMVPNPADPLSLLSFGVSGAAVLAFSWTIARGKALDKRLGYLGYALGAPNPVLHGSLSERRLFQPTSPLPQCALRDYRESTLVHLAWIPIAQGSGPSKEKPHS